MENSNVKENLEVLFEKFKNMIKVETVVGEACANRRYYTSFHLFDVPLASVLVQTTAQPIKAKNLAAVAVVPRWNQVRSLLLKVTASNCSTLRAILTAAALIALSVWYLISYPNEIR